MPAIFGGTAVKAKPSSGARRDWSYARRSGRRRRAGWCGPGARGGGVVDIVAVDADQPAPRSASRRAAASVRKGWSLSRRRCASAGPSRCGPAPPCRRRRGLRTASASTAMRVAADDEAGQRGEPLERRARRDRRRRRSGGRARRDRCRYWRPCRSGRSGSSSRRHNGAAEPSRVQKSQMCGPGRPL